MIYAENILLCIAVPLLISLLFLRVKTRRFVLNFLAGMVLCLLAAYISGYLQQASGLDANDAAIFLSPIVEELMKLLPVLFYLLVFLPKERELTDAAVGIGAGFATFENCCYMLSFGAESFFYMLVRGMAAGVMHIASILATALWLIAVRRLRVFSFSAVLGALSISMAVHALYNLLVSGEGPFPVIGCAMPLAAAVLLWHLHQKFTKH